MVRSEPVERCEGCLYRGCGWSFPRILRNERVARDSTGCAWRSSMNEGRAAGEWEGAFIAPGLNVVVCMCELAPVVFVRDV
jgi:hypothetical protein